MEDKVDIELLQDYKKTIAMIDFFKRRQQTDAEFIFAKEPDEDGVARNIFWLDGRSRRAYREFGDVIVFDTTYNTNKYSMPFALFVDVNHHKQSIFIGCAIVRDEKKTTFYWLFNTWLEVMGGKKPQTIFIDQDLVMKAAIETVFGRDTVHRCCLWHVMKRARDHLGVLYGSIEGFQEELGAAIDFSWTIVNFETNLLAILKKYKMKGMSTTQRSESMNAVIKIWMGSNTSLYDFATKFEKMVEGVYERESDEDIQTMNETSQLWSCHPMEAEARKVYTRSIFSLFRDNWKRSTALDVHEVEKEKLYEVRYVTKQSKYEWYKSNHMVLIDRINGRANCECKGFLNEGLLCSHVLEVMQQVMRPFLPQHFILRRWTRDVNASTKRGVNEHELEGKDL